MGLSRGDLADDIYSDDYMQAKRDLALKSYASSAEARKAVDDLIEAVTNYCWSWMHD